jgi:hypothetical protein
MMGTMTRTRMRTMTLSFRGRSTINYQNVVFCVKSRVHYICGQILNTRMRHICGRSEYDLCIKNCGFFYDSNKLITENRVQSPWD